MLNSHTRPILLFLFLLWTTAALAQHTLDDLVDIKAMQVWPLNTNNLLDNTITIHTDFSESDFKIPPKCQKVDIVAVDYYYSGFQSTLTFRQRELNRQRFERLIDQLPQVKAKRVKWQVFAQRVNEADKARKVFHGFVLHYRKGEDVVELQAELDLLAYAQSLLKSDSCIVDTVETYETATVRVKTDRFKPNNRKKARRGKTYKRSGIWNRRPYKEKQVVSKAIKRERKRCFLSYSARLQLDSLMKAHPGTVAKALDSAVHQSTTPSDHVVFSTVMNRNKEWKNIVIIMDATTSMQPYVNDMLFWCKLNFLSRQLRAFYFFTDVQQGLKSKFQRKGGVVYVQPEDYDAMAATLSYAFIQGATNMDMPENDAEALQLCLKEHEDDEDLEFIMLVDNTSSVKNLESVKGLNRPVHIVLCGAKGNPIHPDYLYIAHHTGGSVHSVDEDIKAMTEINEGEIVTVAGVKYKIVNGKFKVRK